MKKETFIVVGMKCTHCEANVENVIKKLTGVKSAKANHIEGNISVEYDEKVLSYDSIKAVVEDSAYEMLL